MTVTATSETVPANPANLPVSAVGVKGNTVTLTLARAPGVSQMVTMTYNAPASNPVRDKAGNKAEALTESQKVKSVPTVSVGAVYPKVAPGLGDPEFRVTVSQVPASDLAVTLSFEQADEYLPETTATITIPAGRTSATRTFGIADDYTLASGALTATIAGVGDGYAPAPAPGNAATVQVVVANPPFIVAMWAKNAYTVTEGGVVEATVTLRTAAGVPKPRKDYSASPWSPLAIPRRGRRRLRGLCPSPWRCNRATGWPMERDSPRRRSGAAGADGERQRRRGRRAVPSRGCVGGRSAPARPRLPRRAAERGRGDELLYRGHHRGRRLRGDGGDGDLDAAKGVGHLRRAREH